MQYPILEPEEYSLLVWLIDLHRLDAAMNAPVGRFVAVQVALAVVTWYLVLFTRRVINKTSHVTDRIAKHIWAQLDQYSVQQNTESSVWRGEPKSAKLPTTP